MFNTIAPPLASVPTNPGIDDGAIDVDISAVLSWNPSEYASSYDLYLWTLLDQAKPDIPAVVDWNVPFYEPPQDLEYGTTYFWQVIAKNVMGEVASLMWSFTTEAEPGDTVVPEPGTLILFASGLIGLLGLSLRRWRKRK